MVLLDQLRERNGHFLFLCFYFFVTNKIAATELKVRAERLECTSVIKFNIVKRLHDNHLER